MCVYGRGCMCLVSECILLYIPIHSPLKLKSQYHITLPSMLYNIDIYTNIDQ